LFKVALWFAGVQLLLQQAEALPGDAIAQARVHSCDLLLCIMTTHLASIVPALNSVNCVFSKLRLGFWSRCLAAWITGDVCRSRPGLPSWWLLVMVSSRLLCWSDSFCMPIERGLSSAHRLLCPLNAFRRHASLVLQRTAQLILAMAFHNSHMLVLHAALARLLLHMQVVVG
jgi:hypothetical protein